MTNHEHIVVSEVVNQAGVVEQVNITGLANADYEAPIEQPTSDGQNNE